MTNQVLEALANGVAPWRKPWKGREHMPSNAVSKRTYNGINLVLLSMAKFADHRWMTYRQATELGGSIRRGEKGSLVVFWKILEPSKSTPEDSQSARHGIPLLRHYFVFNAEQVEGLSLSPLPSTSPQADRIEEADQLMRSMPNPPRIVEAGISAYYRPQGDVVVLPPLQQFSSADHFYSTAFHELGHATGHQSRLNRPGVAGPIAFGSSDYSREELVAELTSAFLCAELGLDNSLIEDSASYLSGWLDLLNHDKRAVMVASSQARNACEYIKGSQAFS
ncbi:MAG: ssDNA-binding domain-containing protein [Fimbriimonadaceae bacterium]|nr:ssDNA-binding domain-containing protein [Fimbriimonadaceae bacterium]